MPLVSVPVISYNSAKTVVETLESIKAQSYPNIELIISDDCSVDNTVELCKIWTAKNKGRFERVEIITVEKNTGVAGNCNRAYAACKGEWVKSIAGDDILLPNCIQDCTTYVLEHPNTIYLFGRCFAFGANENECKQIDLFFDYSFFSLTSDEQLHRLVFERNCVPGVTMFYNRERSNQIGVKDDSRIPLLEDWPRWINLLRAGVKFHFIDKELVMYRVGGISTEHHPSLPYYRASRLFCLYYQYPEWYKEDPEKAVERVVADEVEIYKYLLDTENQLNQIQKSKAYQLGKWLLKPFKFLLSKK